MQLIGLRLRTHFSLHHAQAAALHARQACRIEMDDTEESAIAICAQDKQGRRWLSEMNCLRPRSSVESRLFLRRAENETASIGPGHDVLLTNDGHALTGEVAQRFLFGHGQHPSVGGGIGLPIR